MSGRKPMLTLQHFVLQSTLLQAYRSAVRATRPLPDPQTRRETLDFFRSEVERLRYVDNIEVLKSSISSFQRLVKQMVPSIGLGGLTSETGSKLIGRAGARNGASRAAR
ncbi:hypothetical protein DB88DRAFT_496984 [Papiliotrema laurentii]|uniref:Complex 1 LYR protein n=1 Tax=Papiliotrema laurentii TaxID=5418 RepID=A0AAD9CV25_PAPLA|nr:hypothetical protein DB88DRAFT_496984 [Papiliotrema laurentii]